MPDPKWLEVLKATGWQAFAVAAACAAILILSHLQVIPALLDWVAIVVTFLLVLCALLAIGGLAKSINDFFPIKTWFLHYRNLEIERKHVASYVHHMTSQEKAIIAYLLARNQKLFIAATDGGYAMPLISQKIAVRALQPGQFFNMQDTPFVIPDHIWKVLREHEALFAYERPADDGDEPEPWRIPWQLQ